MVASREMSSGGPGRRQRDIPVGEAGSSLVHSCPICSEGAACLARKINCSAAGSRS